MGDPTGFLTKDRRSAAHRPVARRVLDWREVYEPVTRREASVQASRCMSCGVPFCHNACPLGNLVSEWNDLAHKGRWRDASERMHATNNFPELTGRLCPAPCEAACVLSINDSPVTNALVEKQVAEIAWAEGWVVPRPPASATGKTVAVVGSGPAGLAAAQQLRRAGHHVTVYERADRVGGLLRYGIPEFKLEKWVLERRLAQLRAEGVAFRTNLEVGKDLSAQELLGKVDALLLAGGATLPRDLMVPGRELDGICQAMEFLTVSNRVQQGDLAEPTITAAGKRVVVIGGGDTGADCLGTAHRQGAASVHQLEIMPRPPDKRDPSTPWPTWPLRLRTSAAHHEGGTRQWSVSTQGFRGDSHGHVSGLEVADVTMTLVDGRPSFQLVPGSAREIPAELVLLALGFSGPERSPMLAQLGLKLGPAGTVARGRDWATTVEGVFACGDMARGQSLLAWAIAEGRSAAAAVDRWLMGDTFLPAPLPSSAQ
jgi:glutamate synthase (NADPH/NADH) small chain